MTEAEWRAGEKPMALLEILRSKASDRKLRLFAVACCRRLLLLDASTRNRRAIEVAEQFADGKADLKELLAERGAIGSTDTSVVFAHAASMMVWHAAEWAVKGARLAREPDLEEATQSTLCRDIFVYPFRRVAFDPAWRTSTAVAIATTATS